MMNRYQKAICICHSCDSLCNSRSSMYYAQSVANVQEMEIMNETDLPHN